MKNGNFASRDLLRGRKSFEIFEAIARALHIHHDTLEFSAGEIVLLTRLCEGQKATILTLPTQPKPAAEAEVQHRVAYVG
jgi:hypothetical protein